MAKYQIFTDTASDLPTNLRKENNIEYFQMGFAVNGKDYKADLDFKDYSVEEMYSWVVNPSSVIKTSLVTVEQFIKTLTPWLDKGFDILYIACTSVLSGTVNCFRLAAEQLKEKYPDRKIIGMDSTRAGMTLGLMVVDAAKMQQEGKSIDEVHEYLEKEKQHYRLCGTLGTLIYLKRAGRVSGAAAFFANMFGIRPIIVGDTKGHNYVIGKVKGNKAAFDRLFEIVKDTVEGQEHPVIYLGHGVFPQAVEYFKKRFEEELHATVYEYRIGPIIGISCGPETVHIVTKGKEMTLTSPEE